MPVKCIINFAGNAQTKDVSFTLYVDFFRVELRAKQNESFKNKRKAFFGEYLGADYHEMQFFIWDSTKVLFVFPPN